MTIKWHWRRWRFHRYKIMTGMKLDHLSLNRDGTMGLGGWYTGYRPAISMGPFTIILKERPPWQ